MKFVIRVSEYGYGEVLIGYYDEFRVLFFLGVVVFNDGYIFCGGLQYLGYVYFGQFYLKCFVCFRVRVYCFQ